MPPAPAYSALYVKRKAHHVVPFRVMSCPSTALRIISRSATPLPKTHVMSYRVRSCPCPCRVLPLVNAITQGVTVIATCEFHYSESTGNAPRVWISATPTNGTHNVHERHLNAHFRQSAPHTAPNAMRTQQDVHFSPYQV